MIRLIEEYLRTRGVRHFRGHHDDEYFYLVDFFVGAQRCRLNVHLEVAGADQDSVLIAITPDRYYPAVQQGDLESLAARWNATGERLEIVVHDSCDPSLVGVLARGRCRPGNAAELAGWVEDWVASAVGFFGGIATAETPDSLRDAG